MASSAKSFKNRISAISETRGAVAELVRKTGISRQTVDRWIAGTHTPDLNQIDAIASALSTTPSALLDPGSPAVPPHLQDIVKILSHAPPPVLDAVRALLAGFAKGAEQTAAEHHKDIAQKKPAK